MVLYLQTRPSGTFMAPVLSTGEGEGDVERSFICLGFISHVRRVSDEFRYPSDVYPV